MQVTHLVVAGDAKCVFFPTFCCHSYALCQANLKTFFPIDLLFAKINYFPLRRNYCFYATLTSDGNFFSMASENSANIFCQVDFFPLEKCAKKSLPMRGGCAACVNMV